MLSNVSRRLGIAVGRGGERGKKIKKESALHFAERRAIPGERKLPRAARAATTRMKYLLPAR